MAKTLSRQASANGRARLTLWLDAPLKEQLACAAFARGVPAATVVSEALRQYLDATAPDAGPGGPEADRGPAAAEPVRADRVFEHREWRWADGTPRRCRVLAVQGTEAVFARLTATGQPATRRHREHVENLLALHVGRWVPV